MTKNSLPTSPVTATIARGIYLNSKHTIAVFVFISAKYLGTRRPLPQIILVIQTTFSTFLAPYAPKFSTNRSHHMRKCILRSFNLHYTLAWRAPTAT